MRRRDLAWVTGATLLLAAPGAAAPSVPGVTEGVGTCREVTCPCTKEDLAAGMVDTPQGCRKPCTQEEMDRLRGLIGRLKALREVAEGLARELGRAEVGYMKEIDDVAPATYDGPLMKTSVSLANLAGDMAGLGDFKIPRLDHRGLSKSALDRVASATSIAATGGGLWLDPNAFSAGQAMQEAFDTCVGNLNCYSAVWQNEYQKYLEAVDRAYWQDRPRVPRSPAIPPPATYVRDVKEAMLDLKIGQERLLKKAQVLSVGVDLVDLYLSGAELGTALREMLEARKELTELKKQDARTDALMDDVLAQIAALRETCGIEGAPDAAGGGPARLAAGPDASRAAGSRAADPITDAEAVRLEAALATLDRLEGLVEPVLARIWSRVVPSASPFLCPCWRAMDPAFLRALLTLAHPEFAALEADLERVAVTAREPVIALHLALR